MNKTEPELRYCDIVMKGGITSGVVYPLAAWKLSGRFVFKNIGGTSAGAIAAAAAAAAELTRDRNGFDRLRKLPGFLTGRSPEGTDSNLFAFFQPQPATKRLFRICLAGLGGGAGAAAAVAGRALSGYTWATLLGARRRHSFSWRWLGLAPRAVFFGVSLGVGRPAPRRGAALRRRRRGPGCGANAAPKLHGLCSGMSEDFSDVGEQAPAGRGKPLTYWLTEYLNEFLGRSPGAVPLRFGELWCTDDPEAPRQVNLEMMTTCLTHGRPYRLPFRDDDDVRENRCSIFGKTSLSGFSPGAW